MRPSVRVGIGFTRVFWKRGIEKRPKLNAPTQTETDHSTEERGSMATATEFLEDTRRLIEQIRHTEEAIRALDSMLDVQGYDPSRERVSGGSRRDRLAESLGRLQGYRDELAGLLDDYAALQRFADSVVARLPDARHRKVLNMRYLEGADWGTVRKAIGYSERQAQRIYAAAMESLEAVLTEGRGESR